MRRRRRISEEKEKGGGERIMPPRGSYCGDSFPSRGSRLFVAGAAASSSIIAIIDEWVPAFIILSLLL